MGEKVKKVRTSITIDPNVLNVVRSLAEDPESEYKSVAAFIEKACKDLLSKQDNREEDVESDGPEFD